MGTSGAEPLICSCVWNIDRCEVSSDDLESFEDVHDKRDEVTSPKLCLFNIVRC